MPFTVTGADHEKTWSLTCINEATAENQLLARCLALAKKIHQSVPLGTIELLKNNPPPDSQYSYKITDANGRNWSQLIEMDSVTDPLMNWRHQSKWRASEFRKQQNFRDAALELIQSLQPTELTITFL